jgi:hypothetical protein
MVDIALLVGFIILVGVFAGAILLLAIREVRGRLRRDAENMRLLRSETRCPYCHAAVEWLSQDQCKVCGREFPWKLKGKGG